MPKKRDRMKFSEEFKEAVSNLPSIEKDKLIFRLLKKDLVLANRLQFELLSEKSVEELRDEVEERLKKYCKISSQHIYSIGYLSMDVRDMSGLINKHVSVTKDKFGEAWLNLFLLNELLEQITDQLNDLQYNWKLEKFYVAIIARIFKVLLIVNKLHEDYWVEFNPELEKLGHKVGGIPVLMDLAIQNGLDVNWLIKGGIPEDIQSIHKELRENGYLKC
ncbi:hypothetical protein CLU97_3687 [Chryseobacterium sp. 7]|jgi:hypothetical protein|nr:hypothetical protein CLU97_3687 [Chryseobacterium sp. 7]